MDQFIKFKSNKKIQIKNKNFLIKNFSLNSKKHIQNNLSINKYKSNNKNKIKLNYKKDTKLKKINISFVKRVHLISHHSISISGYIKNKQKINQDYYFYQNYLFKNKSLILTAVFDGHGKDGNKVSKFVGNYFKSEIEYLIELNNDYIFEKDFYLKLSSKIQWEISYEKFDTNLSGTTMCIVLIYKFEIYIINLGDSKAIIIKENDRYIETIDHNPNNIMEKKRIENSGGIIKRTKNLKNKFGPFRIWDYSYQYPGLTMSRSFGDNLAHNLGVISKPDFYKENINGNKFIILATDGLWEYYPIKEIIQFINNYLILNSDLKELNILLYEETIKKWKENDKYIDDITIILIKIN